MGISESCEHDMESTVMPQYETDELGIPVTIYNAATHKVCKHCGLDSHSIHYPERLTAATAVYRCKLSEKLFGKEIRFLRKAMGWSAALFAEKFGVAPETVSRWENDKLPMSPANEKLMRLHVLNELGSKAPAIGLSVSEIMEMALKSVRSEVGLPRLHFELIPVFSSEKKTRTEEYTELAEAA